ncbi:MAG: sigma-54 dependent transcriptional regulator [Pseudomonadota bacterium]
MTYKVLCIDDDPDFLIGMRMQLHGIFAVSTAPSIEEGLSLMRGGSIDMVLLDIGLGRENGIEGIRRIKSVDPAVDIVILSGQRDPKTVVEAIRAGAIDYLTKPFDMEELQAIAERQAAARRVRERYDALVEAQNTGSCCPGIIHRSAAVSGILSQTEQLKGHGANVLIVGETGTGKELLARHIHRIEGDARRPFIAVNCAAIPDNLIEAELFGAEAGAYTGAIKRRLGKFELADGGDIFLDEVGALKADMQAKILRVLQEREFCRVGGNELIKADFRVIAATNELLEEKVSRGEFRMDLYHRLRVIQFSMPPLRERVEDIPPLIDHFLARFAKDGAVKSFTPAAMGRLMAYHWPGNVRELANIVQSLSILAPGDRIDESIFPSWALNGCRTGAAAPVGLPTADATVGALKDYVARAERQYIEHALRICNGDKSKAARSLDLGRTTLYGKMKELGLM